MKNYKEYKDGKFEMVGDDMESMIIDDYEDSE